MASKSLRYHYRVQFNHESEGISIPHANYHIFWELQCAELPECIAVSKLPGLNPDPLWRHPSYAHSKHRHGLPICVVTTNIKYGAHKAEPLIGRLPSYGQVGSPSNPELYGNSRMPSGHSRRSTELDRVESTTGVGSWQCTLT
jgi:hypothetical protein